MLGVGEPRLLHAGVVGGSYFDVMGLRPVLGRLLNASDDGAECGGRGGADASILDHLFNSDPAVDRQADASRSRGRRPSSASSSRRYRTRSTPRSSPTW